MKRSILGMAIMLGAALTAEAQSIVEGVSVDGVKMERNGQYMAVDMTLNLSDLEVEGNRAVLLTPCLTKDSLRMELPSVGVYGRRRYYYYVRNGESMLTDKEETSFRAARRPDSVAYERVFPYAEWMNGAELSLRRCDYGCCNTLLAEQSGLLAEYAEAAVEEKFFPELVYIRPAAEKVKTRAIEGTAYIDFPVNKTVIYPDYRRNREELGKIEATIDSVRGDRDVTITSVWLKGYASPESPYAHNRNLAIGRTEALKKHIQQLYHFGEGVIATDFEPEDWEGLRRYVEESNLDHRREILALIDSDREPDNKEWKLKSTYPEEYMFLYRNCYPALRHTDYRITYDIRSYHDAEEIQQVMDTQPQKLSLNEFYVVAQQYEPGSDEFTEVFETAVRMYPTDRTANLNAANAAMRRGDNDAAERYLAKAGDSAGAVYARAALAIRRGDLDEARRLLAEAQELGLEQAGATLDEINGGKTANDANGAAGGSEGREAAGAVETPEAGVSGADGGQAAEAAEAADGAKDAKDAKDAKKTKGAKGGKAAKQRAAADH